ncbi:hypothetical protein [Acinetobacter baumannii]|uniref:hypothetical protein n=1 Tax=Acinetobacter baumannii TaxID=470 RepID=UPI003977C7C6
MNWDDTKVLLAIGRTGGLSDGYTLTHVGKHFFSLAEKAEEHLIAMERYNELAG